MCSEIVELACESDDYQGHGIISKVWVMGVWVMIRHESWPIEGKGGPNLRGGPGFPRLAEKLDVSLEYEPFRRRSRLQQQQQRRQDE